MGWEEYKEQPFTFNPDCVPSSIFCAWTAQFQGNEVRIGISRIHKDNKVMDHAQAEFKKGDKWVPLTNLWDDKKGQTVRECERHFDVEPYRYLSLEDFISEQGKILRGEK